MLTLRIQKFLKTVMLMRNSLTGVSVPASPTTGLVPTAAPMSPAAAGGLVVKVAPDANDGPPRAPQRIPVASSYAHVLAAKQQAHAESQAVDQAPDRVHCQVYHDRPLSLDWLYGASDKQVITSRICPSTDAHPPHVFWKGTAEAMIALLCMMPTGQTVPHECGRPWIKEHGLCHAPRPGQEGVSSRHERGPCMHEARLDPAAGRFIWISDRL